MKKRQSKETGNIQYTRRRDNLEKQATYSTQDEDKQNKNTEKLATYSTQDEDKQNKNTICVGHHYMQTNTNNVKAMVPQLEH